MDELKKLKELYEKEFQKELKNLTKPKYVKNQILRNIAYENLLKICKRDSSKISIVEDLIKSDIYLNEWYRKSFINSINEIKEKHKNINYVV
jgi:hypothetical protein